MNDVTGRGRLAHHALLVLIILLALAARAARCAEGLPYLRNWDEPQTASTALTMMKTGDLNPHFFHYGSFMIYANLVVDAAHYLYLMRGPQDDPASPAGLFDIQTESDTGYHWTISHPSFYLWNRLLTALMGAASVLIAYLLGRDLAGPWAGLLAAGLAAGIDAHVEQSSLVLPNVPAAFFAILGVILSLRYYRTGRWGLLLLGAAACGLAASTKYNNVIAIVAPCLALTLAWWSGRATPRWLWPAVPLAALAAFVAATPYAVLDLPHFLLGVGYEVRHYEVLGHPGSDVAPGLPHLWLQTRTMAQSIGLVPAILVIPGLALALTSAGGWIALAFPLSYLAFMSGTKVSEHRNFVGLYPFAAVAFGCGVVAIADQLGRSRLQPARRRLLRASLLVLAVIPCAVGMARSTIDSAKLARLPETRTLAIDTVNADAASRPRVGLSAELRIHPLDQRRLRLAYEEKPLFDLFCGGDTYGTIVAPAVFKVDRPDEAQSVALMNRLISQDGWMVKQIGEHPWFHPDYMNRDPTVAILTLSGGSHPAPDCSRRLVFQVEAANGDPPSSSVEEVDPARGRAGSDWLRVPPGAQTLVWHGRGEVAEAQSPRIRCVLRQRFGGIEATLLQRTVELTSMEQPYAIEVDLPAGGETSVTFERVSGTKFSIRSVRFIRLPPETAERSAR